jgi:hypothetical protein
MQPITRTRVLTLCATGHTDMEIRLPMLHYCSIQRDMPPINSLKLWFERDIRHATWRDVETLVDQPSVAEIRFATKYYRYTITADELHGQKFLGCTSFDRQHRTTKYLAEGLVDEKTWTEVVEAIDENELICSRPLPGRLF